MLKPVPIKIDQIYVPKDRLKELNLETVNILAEEIIAEIGPQPIHLRKGKGRYVLVSGIHRLEAHKALGETDIMAIIVGARLF